MTAKEIKAAKIRDIIAMVLGGIVTIIFGFISVAFVGTAYGTLGIILCLVGIVAEIFCGIGLKQRSKIIQPETTNDTVDKVA